MQSEGGQAGSGRRVVVTMNSGVGARAHEGRKSNEVEWRKGGRDMWEREREREAEERVRTAAIT
jgi:hypothetical protein